MQGGYENVALQKSGGITDTVMIVQKKSDKHWFCDLLQISIEEDI